VRNAVLAAGLAVALFSVTTTAQAQDAHARPDGYVFGQPHLLTQQLIWGLVHGVRLLATRCRDDGGQDGGAIAVAYAEWLERYRNRIGAAAGDLSRHYFQRPDMPYQALTDALHLKTRIVLRPDELALACASFIAAINSPRYDLDLLYLLHRDAARVERAEAVRMRAAGCLKTLDGEQAKALELALADWVQANELLENVSRSELLSRKGNDVEDRRWRREVGAGAAPPAVACPHLAEALAGPDYSLGNIFEEDQQ
jgi:hypothetical protein